MIFILILLESKVNVLGAWGQSLFDSVVVIAFQITFRVKMHVNDVFFIF